MTRPVQAVNAKLGKPCSTTALATTEPLAARIGPSERARFVLLDEALPAEVLHVDDQILAVVAAEGTIKPSRPK